MVTYWQARCVQENMACVYGLVRIGSGKWGADKQPRLTWSTRTINVLTRDGYLEKHEREDALIYYKATLKGWRDSHKVLARQHSKASRVWSEIIERKLTPTPTTTGEK